MARKQNNVDRWLDASPERRRVLAEERFIVDVTEDLMALVERIDIQLADVAERLGSSRAHVSQVLSGSRNMTLRTLAGFAHVMGFRPKVQFVPLRANDEWCSDGKVILFPKIEYRDLSIPLERAALRRSA